MRDAAELLGSAFVGLFARVALGTHMAVFLILLLEVASATILLPRQPRLPPDAAAFLSYPAKYVTTSALPDATRTVSAIFSGQRRSPGHHSTFRTTQWYTSPRCGPALPRLPVRQ